MLTLTKIKDNNKNRSRWLVCDASGNEVGLIEKFKNTRCNTFPYRAYKGIGFACTYVGCSFTSRNEAVELLKENK